MKQVNTQRCIGRQYRVAHVCRVFVFLFLFLFVRSVFADVIRFNASHIIHIQDHCISNKFSDCSETPHYIYTNLITGKTYKDVAIRTPLAQYPDDFDYAYMDDKGQARKFDELSSEPLFSFHSSAFSDTPYYYRDKAVNTTRLSFKVKKGFNDQKIIWIYGYNRYPNGCGDVASLRLETGEVAADAIVSAQVCIFPNMKLQPAYAAYRKMLQNNDAADSLSYTKLRATFPKGKKRKDEFTEPEWLAVIEYSRPAPGKGRIEILRECGDSDITIEESKEGTEIVHYEYRC